MEHAEESTLSGQQAAPILRPTPYHRVGRLLSGLKRSFYVNLGMVRYRLLQKYLRTLPPIVLIANIAALAWNQPRQGHLRHTTIYQLRRPAQPVPATPSVYRRLPVLPPTTNGNRHSKPAPLLTPLRRSEYFFDTERDYQGGEIPAADPAASFGDHRLPLLPPPTNENRHFQLAP